MNIFDLGFEEHRHESKQEMCSISFRMMKLTNMRYGKEFIKGNSTKIPLTRIPGMKLRR